VIASLENTALRLEVLVWHVLWGITVQLQELQPLSLINVPWEHSAIKLEVPPVQHALLVQQEQQVL
jgi:hypothetical protein